MVANSNEIQAVIDGNAIGFATDTSFAFNNSLVEVTTRATNGWVEKITATRGATISFNGLITADFSNINSISSSLRAGSLVTFRYGSSGINEFSGNGYVGSLELDGGTDSAPTFSGSIEISNEVATQIASDLRALRINGQEICINGETLLVAVQI